MAVTKQVPIVVCCLEYNCIFRWCASNQSHSTIAVCLCLPFVVYCLLSVVCCMLFVVCCYLLFVGKPLLNLPLMRRQWYYRKKNANGGTRGIKLQLSPIHHSPTSRRPKPSPNGPIILAKIYLSCMNTHLNLSEFR